MLTTDKNELLKYSSSHRVWQGIPGIERTRGGRIFISAYSGGTKETYGNYCFVFKSDDEINFSEPIAVALKEGRFRCYDPLLWIDPLNRLWFIWNVMPGEEVFGAICEDPDANEIVFGEEFYIGRGIMMNKPTVLSSGEWLFPIAVWKPDKMSEYRKSALKPDEESYAFVYKTSDNGKSFTRLGGADVIGRAFDEHMVYEMKNGVLRMLVRINNGIGESYSYDRGNNWSRGGDSKLGGPCSRFFIRRLRSGRILLINHYKFSGRNNLTALISEDDGITFKYSLLIDERSSVAYPDAIECDDGYIYITYDRERGAFKNSLASASASAREILMAKITEDDIISGALKSDGGYLKRIVSKLGALDINEKDPFSEPQIEDRVFAERVIEEKDKDPILCVFEKYPINCINVCSYDAHKLDALILSFEKSGCRDVDSLCKVIDFLRHVSSGEKNEPPIVDKIKAFIDANLAEDLSVAAIAKEMNISTSYLSHLFKSVTGTTVTDYRNELRLTKAKLTLINSNKSIGEIAQELGFCSASYFAEIFTKSEKISPSEYKKLHC